MLLSVILISVDQTRVVLNPCKDYRPAARGYINASFITVSWCLGKSIRMIEQSFHIQIFATLRFRLPQMKMLVDS